MGRAGPVRPWDLLERTRPKVERTEPLARERNSCCTLKVLNAIAVGIVLYQGEKDAHQFGVVLLPNADLILRLTSSADDAGPRLSGSHIYSSENEFNVG